MKKAISILILVSFVLAMSASAVSAHHSSGTYVKLNQQNFNKQNTDAKIVVVDSYVKAEAFGKEPVAANGFNAIAESYSAQANVAVFGNDFDF